MLIRKEEVRLFATSRVCKDRNNGRSPRLQVLQARSTLYQGKSNLCNRRKKMREQSGTNFSQDPRATISPQTKVVAVTFRVTERKQEIGRHLLSFLLRNASLERPTIFWTWSLPRAAADAATNANAASNATNAATRWNASSSADASQSNANGKPDGSSQHQV